MFKLLLEGKTAVVTGASKGIGYSIAELFAEEGCNVVAIARNAERLENAVKTLNERDLPGRVIPLAGDAVDEALSKKAIELAISTFGRFDILVNNVGQGESVTIDTTTTEHWEKYVNINLRSAFYFCREAGAHFADTGEGVVINVSSINGVKPGSGATYCMCKGAMIMMTKNMAVRFAGTKVRVNAISPGVTDTPQNANAPGSVGNDVPMYEGAVSMRQFSTPYVNTEIDGVVPPRQQAYAALFLASEMGECITGQNLVIEKGRFFV